MDDRRYEIREQHAEFPFVVYLLGLFEGDTVIATRDSLEEAVESAASRNSCIFKDELQIWYVPLEGEPALMKEAAIAVSESEWKIRH